MAQENVYYKFNHFPPSSGLSSVFVTKILKDPYGFFWVGTQDGLNRFDGKKFEIYNKGMTASHRLTGPAIAGLCLDTLHQLIWVINSSGGIDAVNYVTGNVSFSCFPSVSAQKSSINFNSVALDRTKLYIGSSDGLFVLDTDSHKMKKWMFRNPLSDRNETLVVNYTLVDHNHHLWVFGKNAGVFVLDQLALNLIGMIRESGLRSSYQNSIIFYDAIELNDHRVLASTNLGLRSFSIDRQNKLACSLDPFPLIRQSQGSDVYSCGQDNKGFIWFCKSGNLLRIDTLGLHGEDIKENTRGQDDYWLGKIFHIYLDDDNYCLLGCAQGLAYCNIRSSGFVQFSQSANSETRMRHVYYISPVSDSLIYCCADDGLYKVNTLTGNIRLISGKQPFYIIFETADHNWITSNDRGLFKIKKDLSLMPLELLYPEFRSLGKITFSSFLNIGDSLFIMGTFNNSRLIIWNYKRHKVYEINKNTLPGSLVETVIYSLYQDTHRRIWILGDNAISFFNPFTRSIEQFAPLLDSHSKKPYSTFMDVCEAGNQYFVASYGSGIIVLDSNLKKIREISTDDGLCNNNAYKLISYKDSLLFVTTNNGLSVIDIKHSYNIRNYYESDGMQSNIFEQNTGASFHGIVYAGGLNGITAIQPDLLYPDTNRPALFISHVKMETTGATYDTSDLRLNFLKVSENVVQATIYFSALSYSNPERTTYYYKIKELKGDWINQGAQNFVNLIGLAPGDYTLMVKASNEFGTWSQVKEIKLEYLPKWYQTLWFKAAIFAYIAALFYALYRYRLMQIKKQQQIRKDIASDLHDDIGSTLNTLKIFAHLAKKEPDKEEHLDQVEHSLTQASLGLRDMIWVLDDTKDSVYELMERIKKYALPVCQVNGIHFEGNIEAGETNRVISKTEKRNLFLVAKETINNSLKYAECTIIEVTIRQLNKKIELLIKDNGKGFDMEKPAEGFGLNNIRQRAEQIHYTSKITSAPGKGTIVYLQKI